MKWLIFVALKLVEIGLFGVVPYWLAQLYYKLGITKRWDGKQTFYGQWQDGFFMTFLILILTILAIAGVYGNYLLANYIRGLL